jgi:hypothetical protein
MGDGDPSVQRRDFLRAGSSIAIPGLLAAVVGDGAGAGSATPDVVDELAQRLVSLRKLDDTLGGGDTYRLYAAESELTGHLLRGGAHRDSVQRSLLGVHAEQSQQAGWAAFDAGWHDLARDHYRRSHAAATEAGDAGLAGNALAFHAYQLIGLGRPARLVSEKSVHAADQPGVDPGVRALLYSRAAWTFALDDDADATARCLGRAEDSFALANDQTPDYAAWIDNTELAIMTGRCWSEVRRPLRAVPVLERALAGYSDAHSRDKALYSSWLADSYIDAGEIEQSSLTVPRPVRIRRCARRPTPLARPPGLQRPNQQGARTRRVRVPPREWKLPSAPSVPLSRVHRIAADAAAGWSAAPRSWLVWAPCGRRAPLQALCHNLERLSLRVSCDLRAPLVATRRQR